MDPARRLRLTRLAVACGLALSTAPANAQHFEFTGAELRGRIDQPSLDNIWTVGDDNGNGAVDDNESFVMRVDIAEAFLENPGRTFTTIERNGFAYDLARIDGGDSGDLSLNSGRNYPDIALLLAPSSFAGRAAYARFGGAQLTQVLRFQSDPQETLTATEESLEIAYGARFLTGWQDFRRALGGGVLGQLLINSRLESQSLGPHASVKWSLRKGPWHARAEAAAALTFMSLAGEQVAQIGADRVIGQYNRPLYFSPARTNDHLNEWDLAPVVEAGLLAGYDITSSALCFIRCDAIQFGNVRDVEQSVVYQLPSMGLRDPGGGDVTITSASIGLELRR